MIFPIRIFGILATGLPSEKWSSLRYGFVPAGGREDGEEAAYGRGDRQQAAAVLGEKMTTNRKGSPCSLQGRG